MRTLLIGLAFTFAGCRGPQTAACPEVPAASSPAAAAASTAAPIAPAAEAEVSDAEPTAAGPLERERHEVVADDGHALAVWAKVPETPRGAIVLLHGRTWSGRPDFDLQVPGEARSTMDALAAAGLATYALDLRGYGETLRDATGWNTPDRAAKDLLAVLRWVGERHEGAPALLGWSLGSLTSQLAAQREPGLVSALILYGYPRSPDRRYKADRKGVEPARAATTAKGAASDFIIPGNISQAGIDAFVEQALAADPVRTDWRGTEEWNELDPGKVTVPTLVMHGAKDPYAPKANQVKLFNRLAAEDRAYVVIAGGDHAAHLEDVGPRFIDAVLGFVDARR
ncbi:MAG: alpha/beta fold hydrolase [Myxococcota bacterium]